jgi:hypothetical protein
MNLKLTPIEINPDNPFKNDLLNREEEIKNLTALATHTNSSTVIAINSPWGTGKTTFLDMWANYLDLQNIDCIRFNAWSTDFAEDPFIAFLGEINASFETLTGSSEAAKKEWGKTKAVGKQIAKRGIPALVKILTLGVINTDEIVEEELGKVLEELAGDALDNYSKEKTAIKEFHESFSKVLRLTNTKNPILIFVDELDRCRPSYAISLLERIKHLFNIDGLIFVLATDKSQLSHSIGAVYGQKFDSLSYLRRFIDFEYTLKEPNLEVFIEAIFNSLSLNDYFAPRGKYRELTSDKSNLLNTLKLLAKAHNFSLREAEQILASINLALLTANDNEYIHPELLSFLIVTKNKEPELYRRYIVPTANESEMIDYLDNLIDVGNKDDSRYRGIIAGYLIAAKGAGWNHKDSDVLVRYTNILADEASSSEEKKYAGIVLHVAANPTGSGHGVKLKDIINRIELITQFKFDRSNADGNLKK